MTAKRLSRTLQAPFPDLKLIKNNGNYCIFLKYVVNLRCNSNMVIGSWWHFSFIIISIWTISMYQVYCDVAQD